MMVVEEVMVVVVVEEVMGWLINGDGQQVHLRLLRKLQREELTQRVSDTSRGSQRLGLPRYYTFTADTIPIFQRSISANTDMSPLYTRQRLDFR